MLSVCKIMVPLFVVLMICSIKHLLKISNKLLTVILGFVNVPQNYEALLLLLSTKNVDAKLGRVCY